MEGRIDWPSSKKGVTSLISTSSSASLEKGSSCQPFNLQVITLFLALIPTFSSTNSATSLGMLGYATDDFLDFGNP